MRKSLRFLGTPLMILALILITGTTKDAPVFAQVNEPIMAGVDRMELSTDDTVTLTVVVDVADRMSLSPNFLRWMAFPSSATAHRHR